VKNGKWKMENGKGAGEEQKVKGKNESMRAG
jgi:hypothetical protein